MADFIDQLTDVSFSEFAPDWDILGGRLYVVNGLNPNLAFDANAARIMGSYPDQSTVTAVEDAGAVGPALEANGQYQYAVARIVTQGSLVIESDFTLAALLTVDGTANDGLVTFEDTYEYPPPTAEGWVVTHRIYRSKKDVLTILYKVEDVDDAAGSSPYTDTTTEANLDLSTSINIEAPLQQQNAFIPPVSYIRTWRKRLLCYGSRFFRSGDVSNTSTTVTVSANGDVREVDRGALLKIENEPFIFTITDADPGAKTWTVSPAPQADQTDVGYTIYRPGNDLYLSNILGSVGSVEHYQAPTFQLVGDDQSGNNGTGLAVNGGNAYVFNRRTVATVNQLGTNFQLRELPGMPGCVSHATIADRFSPFVVYYAGEEGVWLIVGGEAKKLSSAIDLIIRDDIDHDFDEWTHGIYDPINQLYHLWVFKTGSVAALGIRIPQLMLTYNFERDEWYPNELAASASGLFQSDGELVPIIGLPGTIAKLEGSISYDAYTFNNTFVAGDTIVDDGFTLATAPSPVFPTADSGLAGVPVHIIRRDTKGRITTVHRRIIKENTSDSISLWSDWDVDGSGGNPSATPGTDIDADEWTIGWIHYFAEKDDTGLLPDWGHEKKFTKVQALVDPDTAENKMVLQVLGTREKTVNQHKSFDMNANELLKMSGSNLGTNARAVKVRFEGNSDRDVTVKTLSVERTGREDPATTPGSNRQQ